MLGTAACWVIALPQGAVLESGNGSTDVPAHSARCQEGKEPVKVVGGVIHCAGGLADAAFGVGGEVGGKRDPDDLLSCSHNLLLGLVF